MEKIRSVLWLPDGNARWAEANGISFEEAYYCGGKVLELLVDFFLLGELSQTLIFHAMSSYTWKRRDETLGAMVAAGCRLFNEWLDGECFSQRKIGVQVLSNGPTHPKKVEVLTDRMSQETSAFPKRLIILFGYSLENDIEDALSRLELAPGLQPKTYKEFRHCLIFPDDIDLVIRTKEMRISGGPIYAMPQAQMMIIDKLNPDVRREDLERLWQSFCEIQGNRRTHI